MDAVRRALEEGRSPIVLTERKDHLEYLVGQPDDDARLDTLFLTLLVSWRGTLIQYAGRLHRLHPTKTEVRIYDYVDSAVRMLARMFQRRHRGYRAIGYEEHGMREALPERREQLLFEANA